MTDKPPQIYSEEAELATLGALMMDPEAGPPIFTVLDTADFYITKHRMIYEAMRELYHQSRPYHDYLILAEQLEHKRQLHAVGGMAFLAALAMHTPSVVNVDHYAETIRNYAARRRALDIASQIAQLATSSNGSFHNQLQAIAANIAAMLPESPTQQAAAAPGVPPLPDHIRIEPSTAGAWLDAYSDYAAKASPMTPTRFHTGAALWLASSVIARRLVLKMSFGDIYPNVWIAWIARSTLFGKSTSMDIARKLALQAAPHLLTPEDMTPEGLIMDMSGTEPANLMQMRMDDQQSWTERRNFASQRAWTMDEFSGLLAASGKDYNAGLIEILLRFYDCTEKYDRLTAGRGLQCIHNAYLTLLAASTPTALAAHLMSERLWGMGFWPRFAILTPDTDRPEWARATDPGPLAPLAAPLRQLYQRLPRPRWPDPLSDLPVTLGDGVFDLWEAYSKALRYDMLSANLLDDRFWAAYGRLPVHALKVAVLIAALDWGDTPAPRVELPHLHRALAIVEDWRGCLHKAVSLAEYEAQDRIKQAVLYQISRVDPLGITLRDIYKGMKRKPSDIERAIEELQRTGEIVAIESQSQKGGPKTIRYVLARG